MDDAPHLQANQKSDCDDMMITLYINTGNPGTVYYDDFTMI